MNTPTHHVHQLFRRVHGWTISPAEERRVLAAKSSPTYGEIRPAALARLLDRLALGKRDVLYDLGSGIGKVVVQAAMSVQARRIVGVELVASRHAIAERVLARARERELLSTRRVDLLCADFMRVDVSDATVVYTCSTAFSDAFMRAVARRLARVGRPGLTLVTTQELDPPGRFVPLDELELDMSWRRRARVHLYRLDPPAKSRATTPRAAART
jgi:ubiquinone/menaquinone biosynthesis C-methylase UbiE